MSDYYETCPKCGNNLVPVHGTYQMSCPPDALSQPAEDERVKDAEREFLEASVAVWREIDRLSALPEGYKGLDGSTELRQRERAAWERYKTLLPVQPAPCPKCGHSETDANGWCMSGRPYIANEPDSNKRSICSCRCVQPAASTPTEDGKIQKLSQVAAARVQNYAASLGKGFTFEEHGDIEYIIQRVFNAAVSTEAQDERKL